MSERFTLNNTDWKKIGVGALMAMIGGALTYLLQYLGGVDFGQYQGLATVVLSILANTVRKWVEGK